MVLFSRRTRRRRRRHPSRCAAHPARHDADPEDQEGRSLGVPRSPRRHDGRRRGTPTPPTHGPEQQRPPTIGSAAWRSQPERHQHSEQEERPQPAKRAAGRSVSRPLALHPTPAPSAGNAESERGSRSFIHGSSFQVGFASFDIASGPAPVEANRVGARQPVFRVAAAQAPGLLIGEVVVFMQTAITFVGCTAERSARTSSHSRTAGESGATGSPRTHR